MDEGGEAGVVDGQTAEPGCSCGGGGGDLELRLSTGFEVEVAAMLSGMPAAATPATAGPAGLQQLPVLHDVARDMSLRRELPLVCHVIDCGLDLLPLPDYYQRYRICKAHLQSPAMVVDGAVQRFCQQCGRFQAVEDFDGDKRNCRARLQQHNTRRRKVSDKLPRTGRARRKEAEWHCQQGEVAPRPVNLANTTFSGTAGTQYDSMLDAKQVPSAGADPAAFAAAMAAATGPTASAGAGPVAANPAQRLAGHKREFAPSRSTQQQQQQRRKQPLSAGLPPIASHSRPQPSHASWLPGWNPQEVAPPQSLARHPPGAAAQVSNSAIASLGTLTPQASSLLEHLLQRAAVPQVEQVQSAPGWLPTTALACQPAAQPLDASTPQLAPLAAYLSQQLQAMQVLTPAVAGLPPQQQPPHLQHQLQPRQPQQPQQAATWEELMETIAAGQQRQLAHPEPFAPLLTLPQHQHQHQQQHCYGPGHCGVPEDDSAACLHNLLLCIGALSSRPSDHHQQQQQQRGDSSMPIPRLQFQQPQQPQQPQPAPRPDQNPLPLAAAAAPSPPDLQEMPASLLAAHAWLALKQQPAETAGTTLQQLMAMLAAARN